MKYSFGKPYSSADDKVHFVQVHRNEDGRYVGVITTNDGSSTISATEQNLIKFHNKKFKDELEVLDEINKDS